LFDKIALIAGVDDTPDTAPRRLARLVRPLLRQQQAALLKSLFRAILELLGLFEQESCPLTAGLLDAGPGLLENAVGLLDRFTDALAIVRLREGRRTSRNYGHGRQQ